MLRWYRVQRAYSLLRLALKVNRETPKRGIVVMAQYAVAFNVLTGHPTPAEITNALEVIKSEGKVKPIW